MTNGMLWNTASIRRSQLSVSRSGGVGIDVRSHTVLRECSDIDSDSENNIVLLYVMQWKEGVT